MHVDVWNWKTKYFAKEVLQKATFAEIRFLMIPRSIFHDFGGLGINFHDFCCLGDRLETRWIFMAAPVVFLPSKALEAETSASAPPDLGSFLVDGNAVV